ncbi:MAG TPA: UDP-N-acetylglucosamine 1-carboxyvinyltransferase, partial [Smithellaceae bacterium]|nr:UDP-N-acetylglucosamine 1-carboxyvinyltransferase [Smithellaceae bacterium]
GDVQISGAKNAALPVLTAALLTEKTCKFSNIPDLVDIKTIYKLLRNMGVEIEGGSTVSLCAEKITESVAPYDLVKTMRASILVLGPLVARTGYARVSLPGGCAIGARPVNLHIKALQDMGAKVELHGGYIEAKAKKLKGAEIYFDLPTVTGTENIMMAAALAEGTTVLRNAACEPEVVNLADVLKGMGAKISGAGTDVITITGVSSLQAVEAAIIPDRIEAGTFMIAVGMTNGEVNVLGCNPAHLESLINKLRDTGMKISPIDGGLKVAAGSKISSVDVKTLPYPGFATDLQAQMMAYMAIGSGLSVISETVFENRFMHVSELMRMGADITIQGGSAIVRGVPQLYGAQVMATDLRASASLVLAALVAQGSTEISRVYHLDRGYEALEKKFSALGADIQRIK